MVDLKGQYAKIQKEVDEAILNVVRNTQFINGPDVSEFSKELADYLGVKHVIPCANGTDALQLALMALELKPGDEVITTDFTFIATAEVIALLNLTPVLVDVDPETYCIDPKAVEAAITPKTKAIIPVHLFGQCAPMDDIMRIAKANNIAVVEDNAQAIGADYTFEDGTTLKAGGIGDIGCTSFFPSKNLGCYGDGGAVFTNNDELADYLKQVANHGMTTRYYHDRVGVNSRLDSIQAAVLRIKLRKLDEYNKARQQAAAWYRKHLADCDFVTVPKEADNTSHVYHQYVLKTQGVNRDDLLQHISSTGIACNVYYPVPLHMQKAYQDDRYTPGTFPVSKALSECVIALPIHTEMDEETIITITNEIKKFKK